MKQLADKPFALIGINSDDDLVQAQEDNDRKDITWRSFWNGENGTAGPISTKWGVTNWPTIYVIDAKGVIRYKNVRNEELDEAITKLMAEAGHEVEITHEDGEASGNSTDSVKSKDEIKK